MINKPLAIRHFFRCGSSMIKNYLKTALRNFRKNKVYSFINIGGLAVGMAVAFLIGLWIYDELSFNKYYENYDRIGKVWQFVKFDVVKSSYDALPIPLANELRTKYPDFKYVSLSSQNRETILAIGDKKLSKLGNYVEPDFVDMFSLKMLAGSRGSLKDINSILISGSLAKAMFGRVNPINQVIKLNNKLNVKVSGVYEDFPDNTSFKDVQLLGAWELYAANDENAKTSKDVWDNNSWNIYAQLKEGANFSKVSAAIKDIRIKKANPPGYKPEFFVFPMSRWHLYGDFYDGVNTGGTIKFVWLFGITGIFVLLLACINFMNLSTARSEKRAKEVGIRKAVGSVRRQLIMQFLSESISMSLLALVIGLFLVQMALPLFNEVSGKNLKVLWLNPVFWLIGIGFALLTGLVAGSYPALYLSSFNPVKVLKGTFKAGRLAAIPRKVLVVVQFSVSVTLIIGTIIVFRQVQYAKDRPVGYERRRLLAINMNTSDLFGHFQAIRTDLINTGAVYEIAESSGYVTEQYGGTTNISWKGKTPNTQPLVMSNSITHEYGKTVGWHLTEGRDFNRSFSMDTASMILNKSAVKLMGFANPVGESITYNGRKYNVIGVIDDMVKESPFKPVTPSFFVLNYKNVNAINIRLADQVATNEALDKVAKVFKKYNPGSPFDYKFMDEEYGQKFNFEERIGKIAGFFATLAIFISCLGLFGLASFVAEQRTREIGVRKVLGATVFNVWKLLSKEFIILVIISIFISMPVTWYYMNNWLQNYQYRVDLSWWIFFVAGMGAVIITIITVSFQAIKAALMNPAKTLRSE